MRSLALLALLSAAPALAQAFPVTITDGVARPLTFDAARERAVCTYDPCAHELHFVGAGPVAVGAPRTPELARDPTLRGAAAERFATIRQDEVDDEALAVLDPGLIPGWEVRLAPASGLAPVFVVGSAGAHRMLDRDEFVADIRSLARLFGRTEEAEARIEAIRDRLDAHAALPPRDRSVQVVRVSPDLSFQVPPTCGIAIEAVAICPPERAERRSDLATGALLSLDPDMLIVGGYGNPDLAGALAAVAATDPPWPEPSAVRAGRVHAATHAAASLATIQSLAHGLDTLMPLLSPGTFPAPLAEAQVAAALAGG